MGVMFKEKGLRKTEFFHDIVRLIYTDLIEYISVRDKKLLCSAAFPLFWS